MIEKAIKIAIREWNNIRRSLEKCGDIGKLAPEEVVTDDPILMLTKTIFTFHLKPYGNRQKNFSNMDIASLMLQRCLLLLPQMLQKG